MIDTRPEEERVFLIGLRAGAMQREEAEASLAELRRLAVTTDAVVVGELLLHVRNPDPATFVSSGLIAEAEGPIAASEAGTVILDDDISPRQQNNLENRWSVKLLTRSELILDIFARRAHTSEGKLQVELAQHRFRLPRLRGHGVTLSRLGGGIGTRGPGEMKLEVDRRAIDQRIHTLEQKIARLKRQRATQRDRRRSTSMPTVALVGYTNAGKSTLLNALTGAGAFVEDKLFATLDTTTRRGELPSGMPVAFIDTVGFINRLPTQLAAAFRATLEEVLYADILVHVVDATSPAREREIEVTRRVLSDLGAGATPTVLAWNKIDRLEPADPEPEFLEQHERPSVAISAIEGRGLDRLQEEIRTLIDQARPMIWLRFDYNDFRHIDAVESEATVHERRHKADGVYLLSSLPPELLSRYEAYQVPPPRPEPKTPRAEEA